MPKFLISAGEASGDIHAAQLMDALRACAPGAEFFGLGGAAMRAAGCDLVLDAREVAVLGLAEVVAHLPRIYGEFRRLLRAVDARRPDAAILIDFPDFNFRLARELHRRGIPVFYYISPQLWAWRQGRIKLVRKYVRKMLVIFPFEEQFYREHGVEACYVGHPFACAPPPALSRQQFAAENSLDPDREAIALLPGSRRKEVGLILPEMLAAAALLARRQSAEGGRPYQFLLPVASTLDADFVQERIAADFVRERIAAQGQEETAEPAAIAVKLTSEARATLAYARAAIVASGTATLETALLGTPFVMVYRVAPLTWALGRRFVTVPHFGIVNLVLGRRAVPELVQQDFTAEKVVAALEPLLASGAPREHQLTAFAELRQKLQLPGPATPPTRAAEAILQSQ